MYVGAIIYSPIALQMRLLHKGKVEQNLELEPASDREVVSLLAAPAE